MPLNRITMWRQLLTICACGSACTGAWAQCESTADQGCDDAYVYDGDAVRKSLDPWLGFAARLEIAPVRYPATGQFDRFRPGAGLSFDLNSPEWSPAAVTDHDALALNADSEPALALLFGSVARLRADGTMALGRSSERSNSPTNSAGYWDDILPAAFYSWDDRLDVDLGLSYAGDSRWTTSVGFAEKIGEQNNDPAFVGWFEFRF